MPGLTLFLALAVTGATQADGFAVIVHPESRITTVSRAELSKIFLRRLRTWSDGTAALPVDQLPDRGVRQRFSREVHGRSVVTVEVYWKRMIFSGRAVPPDELASDREVIDHVRTHPGAVGYVEASTKLSGVRRLPLSD